MTIAVQEIWEEVKKRDPNEVEFQQAVEEVLDTAMPVFTKHPEYIPVMKRLVEPERVIMFRVRALPLLWAAALTGQRRTLNVAGHWRPRTRARVAFARSRARVTL